MLHFNAGLPSSGTVGENDYVQETYPSVVIETVTINTDPGSEVDWSSETDVYYQLGRVFIDDGKMKIVQDHMSGIPHLLYFGSWCPR